MSKAKEYNAEVKGFVEKDGKELLHIVLTKEEVDRDGDILLVEGGDLSHYIKNPLVFFQHSSYGLPIGKGLHLEVKGKQIEGWLEFREGKEDIEEIKECIKGGFLSAISIGFMILEANTREPTKKERESGYNRIRVISKWELLEISVVTVQSNRGALIKAFGIDEKVFNPSSEILTEIKNLLESFKGKDMATEEKAGRKISKANEKLLDTIYDSIVKLRKNLGKEEGEEEEEEKSIEEIVEKTVNDAMGKFSADSKTPDEEEKTPSEEEVELDIKNYKFNKGAENAKD